jgi:hypothetical protein
MDQPSQDRRQSKKDENQPRKVGSKDGKQPRKDGVAIDGVWISIFIRNVAYRPVAKR